MSANSRQLHYLDFGVGGMTCDGFVRTVADALEAVPGVEDAEVSLHSRSARVAAHPSVEAERLTAGVRSCCHAFVRSSRGGG